MGAEAEMRQRTVKATDRDTGNRLGEKTQSSSNDASIIDRSEIDSREGDGLAVTADDLLEAEELAGTYSLETVHDMMQQVYKTHRRDPNFPATVLDKIEAFLNNEDILKHPENHEALIKQMKIEAALITNNSPYGEVRAVVPNHDDPSMPCSTIRAWFIGIIMAGAIAFVNMFFDIRFPAISVTTSVAQLLSYPVGVLMAYYLPDVGFTLFGVRHSLNPGPFNRKEHMLITIMSNVTSGGSTAGGTYSNFLFWVQVQPQWLNMPWAKSFGYQILVSLSTNIMGYSLAGLLRTFLVYPSYCIWPQALVTIALNSSFHSGENPIVNGPFKTIFRISRFKLFCFAFLAMFCYFWIPNYLFLALATFSWMSWIDPNNRTLATITGVNGFGVNPFFTFDWNYIAANADPLVIPFFSTFSFFLGCLITLPVVVAIYYTNSWQTAYLPPVNVGAFDRFGLPYNTSKVLDANGILDVDKYKEYSPPYISVGSLMLFMMSFATYTVLITYSILYHRTEIMVGFRDVWRNLTKKKAAAEANVVDVHARLMKSYTEVPDWWYLIVLVIAIALGCAGIASYPTNTSPGVVFYGLIIGLIFIIPTGIVFAMTGIQISVNVLSELIGGAWVDGNGVSMMFFKTYGFITVLQAQNFAKDMKLAHYMKIPPRVTFFAQMVPTIILSFVAVGILQYQMNLEDVCTLESAEKFWCLGQKSAFRSTVLWGVVGPNRLFGRGGQYSITLIGFPIGIFIALFFWGITKAFPRNYFLSQIHPVVLTYGMAMWAPYNIGYWWPPVPIAAVSWLWLRKRYLAFWSKYNYVIPAAFSCAIAISALVQFGLQYHDISVSWWGTKVLETGCDTATWPCPLKELAEGEFFGPGPGQFRA